MKNICFFFMVYFLYGQVVAQIDIRLIPKFDFNFGKNELDSALVYYLKVIDDIIPENDTSHLRSSLTKKYPMIHGSIVINEMMRITNIKAIDTTEEGQYASGIVIDITVVEKWKNWITKNRQLLYWDIFEKKIMKKRK